MEYNTLHDRRVTARNRNNQPVDIRVEHSRMENLGDTAYLNLGNGPDVGVWLSYDQAVQVRDTLTKIIEFQRPPVAQGTRAIIVNDARVDVPVTVYNLLEKIWNGDDEDDGEGWSYGDRDIDINVFLPAGVTTNDPGGWELP